MVSIFELLGLDEEDLTWQDMALCKNGMNTNDFHENYESNERVAKVIDQTCLSCPVMAQCLQSGVENNEWGVWGGVYLSNGKVDAARNDHKTPQVWKEIGDRIGGGIS
jgi:hypothetical protein